MKLKLFSFLIFFLFGCLVTAGTVISNDSAAIYYDANDTNNWDQRCLLETIQGIVNRKGPRLFLNSPAWDMPWDNQWIDIYSKHNGLKFRNDIQDIPSLLKYFKNDINGIVVYDPKIDGSRYTAMTLAGIENLLPLSPGLLQGYFASYEQSWTGIDFSKIDVYQLQSEWGAGILQSCWYNDIKLNEGVGVVCKSIMVAGNTPNNATNLEFGPLVIDIDKQPNIEVTCDNLINGSWQLQMIIGNDVICLEGGTEKIKRWELSKFIKTNGKVRIRSLRLWLNGKASEITWKSIRFLNKKNKYIPIDKPLSLTKQIPLEVKYDFRGKFKNTIDAYEWGLKNLLPRCDANFAHTIDGVVDGVVIGSGPWRSCDFAVMKKGFIFNLSFNDKDTAAFGITYKADPNQAKMYRKILASLKQPAFITGYGDCENDWFPLMNEYGHEYLVPQYCNISFHNAVKPNNPVLKQKKRYTVDNVQVDPNKYYVCFISSDGDTMKGPISQHYQSWNTDKKRGSVPFTFDIPFCMGRYFPAMLEYYYDTATENDYISACAVLKLNSSPEAAKKLYARFAEDMKISDYDTICDVSLEPVENEKYQLFSEIIKPLGIAQIIWWHGSSLGDLTYMNDGTPLITNPEWFGYCQRATDEGKWEATMLDVAYKDKELWKKTVQQLVDYCELTASKHKPPFVIIIFPSLHHHYIQYSICSDIANALNKDKYKVVRFDEASAIMKKYNQENKAK